MRLTLSGEFIDDIEYPEGSVIGRAVYHEIVAPTMIFMLLPQIQSWQPCMAKQLSSGIQWCKIFLHWLKYGTAPVKNWSLDAPARVYQLGAYFGEIGRLFGMKTAGCSGKPATPC
jgi:hypothetical protein